jgi:DNA mismatch repair ATPase MutS
MAWPVMALMGELFQRFNEIRKKILRYKTLMKAARDLAEPLQRSNSPALREIGKAFASTTDPEDPESLVPVSRAVSRTIGGWWTFPLDFLFAWSAKTLPISMRKIAANGARIARLLGAIGELDAYLALTDYALAQKHGYTFPEFLPDDSPTTLEIDDAHYPLYGVKEVSVGNSIRLGAGPGMPRLRVATGSNMGGKSTHMKTGFEEAVQLAQIGSVVPAKRYRATILEGMTSMNFRDSQVEGKSLYDVETDVDLVLVEHAGRSKRTLFIFDEPYRGTNQKERRAIIGATMKYMMETGNLIMMSTHEEDIPYLDESDPLIEFVHVEQEMRGGRMTFTYKILPGKATLRNGILTLEQKGYPQQIVDDARRAVEKMEKNAAQPAVNPSK